MNRCLMANGEIIEEVKNLLESDDKDLPIKSAVRLMLTLQMQQYADAKQRGDKIDAMLVRLERVERTSIVLWVLRNPKLALFLAGLGLVLSLMVDLRAVLLRALGL